MPYDCGCASYMMVCRHGMIVVRTHETPRLTTRNTADVLATSTQQRTDHLGWVSGVDVWGNHTYQKERRREKGKKDLGFFRRERIVVNGHTPKRLRALSLGSAGPGCDAAEIAG